MDSEMVLDFPETGGTSFNQKTAVTWVEGQPEDLQFSLAQRLFQELLDLASRPKQSSGNACSKLCGFVENCSRSASGGLLEFAFAEETTGKLFDYFIEWNEQDAHRSMRLVLDFIVFSIKSNPDQDVAKSIKSAMLRDTVSIITLEASRPSTKSSMIALDHLIQKKIVYLGEVLSVYQNLQGDASNLNATWDSLISRVFAWMELQYVWTVAGKLIVTVFTHPWYPDNEEPRHNTDTWYDSIVKSLKTNIELLEPIKVYVFMPLFTTDPTASLVFLKKMTSLQKLTANVVHSWDLNAMIWVALLEAGRKMGVISDPDNDDGSTQNVDVTGHLSVQILEIILCNQSHEARASGLSILLASPSTSKPYAKATLDLLRRYLPSFYEDVDPKVRYGVLGHSRNMVRRLHVTIESLRRELARKSKKMKQPSLIAKDTQTKTQSMDIVQQDTSPSVDQKLSNTLHEHEDFIQWYVGFLKGELVPTASYQRHITSLRAMGFFLKSALAQGDTNSVARWPASLLLDAVWFRSILDLILDPYDDVREHATYLIILLQCGKPMSRPLASISGLPHCPYEEIQYFCQKAEDMAQKTARADHCDGAARSQELLYRWSPSLKDAAKVLASVLSKLEQKLLAAENDLATAVLEAPVHGDFASLRYIWSAFMGIEHSSDALETLHKCQERAIECCGRIWQAVQHILCDDSPEGHLPEELQQVEGLDTKDLLSYSFRAVHESSNLMRIIAQNIRDSQTNGLLSPTCQKFEDIGRLTFEQLSTLRHRGAFSTVSQTFTACCQLVQVVQSQSGEEIDLLDDWYRGALNCIYTQASLTRRSAGIPAIIVGILASKASKPSFADVMTKLQEIGREPAYVSRTDGSNLSQVHALNCLKDVFKTSFLSHLAAPYLTDCLQLAAQSLQSELWAIRNCGLLLLRSLIDNLFGMNESKLAMEVGWDGRTIRISYNKYKALPDLLINLLELGKQSSGLVMGTQTAEAVFPALDIIRRAGPPDGYRDKLYDCIAWYLGSRIWHVREIAARTLCSLLLTPTWLVSIEPLLAASSNSANKLHGALLTLKFLLERLLQVMPEQLRGENMEALALFLDKVSTSYHSFYTCSEAQAVYIDILNFITALRRRNDTFDKDPRAPQTLDGLVDATLQFAATIKAPPEKSEEPLALLHIRTGETVAQQLLKPTAHEALDQKLNSVLTTDINVACAMLEAMADLGVPQNQAARLGLVKTYLHVCLATDIPEPRRLALESLASLLDIILRSEKRDNSLEMLVSDEMISSLWLDIEKKSMNPALSDAILRVSGPLIAISLLRTGGGMEEDFAARLRNWGIMMSDAGIAEQPFDTRIAAIEAINSFSNVIKLPHTKEAMKSEHPPPPEAHLPWLLALYDALRDDDIDVREAAAAAATPIIGTALVPIEASYHLLQWLALSFSNTPKFRRHVAERMIGHKFGCLTLSTLQSGGNESWVSAEAQLQDAMQFDDALFVIEEHNQYIDEVQEAKRWADIFQSFAPELPVTAARSDTTVDATTQALTEWTLSGLRTLISITQSEFKDGPLGWTTKPQVFAICARILICATALMKSREQAQDDDLRSVVDEVRRFRELGNGHQVHGLLLKMCELVE
ncbi:hypothetical protein F5Y16DRAFT_395706 [Xylariaceae sp. FL0255]|nr:hypothetical protein F5Y16DRAFT_395706 [Xylariaceae sp. FL0255]